MTNSLKPRTRPAPAPRDQQIYLDYQTTGRPQTELAADYKLTQCRISQILRRVDRWLTGREGVAPAEPSAGSTLNFELRTLNPADLERRLERERVNLVSREAIRHFHTEQKTITHKKGHRGDKPFDETTERIHPPSLQALKVVLQANAQQQRLSVGWDKRACERRPTKSDQTSNSEPGTLNSQPLDRQAIQSWLADQIDTARQNGKISFFANTNAITNDLVSHILGEPTPGFSLDALAEIAGKKVVNKSSYEQSPPQVPPIDGWYYAMYDSSGKLVTWLHASLFADHLPPDHKPDLFCKGANKLPPNTCLKADIPPDYPPVSAAAPSTPENSVPGSSLGPHFPGHPPGGSSPASSPPIPESPATTDESNTDSLLTPTSITCAPAPDSSQPQPPHDLPIQNQKSKTQNKPRQTPSNPEQSLAADNAFRRRLAHLQKLDQLREARASGRPYYFYFDAADGPLPPESEYILDGA